MDLVEQPFNIRIITRSPVGIVRLGKMHLRWCEGCNVPVLEAEACGRCGGATKQVQMTPPGDARPAFDHDLAFLRALIDGQFGPGTGHRVLPLGKIVLMSKVPGVDRMEEIIVDGEVIGTLRYDLGVGSRFIMRVPAARRLQGGLSKGMVIVDDGAITPILTSHNLMAPGVLQAFDGIEKGDEVIMLDKAGHALATGVARMGSAEMLLNGKGVAVKTRWAEPSMDFEARPGTEDWDMVIEANRPVMKDRIDEAVKFILEIREENHVPAVISFSGGKDSLACLLLARDAGLDLPVLFIDTGLEFPETVTYVHEVARHYGLDLIIEKAPEDAFYGNLEYFGPPGRDYRWCCKTNKLGPTVRAIMRHFPDGVLSFIGQRRYESEQRADKPRVWRNPWTPGQVGASPIQNWTALHVWIYIFMRKAPYNPWYAHGLDRIGCFLCPASDMAELVNVASQSEGLRHWNTYLEEYAGRRQLPKEWVGLGLWRWKRLPPSIKEELQRNGVTVDDLLVRKCTQKGDGQERLRLHMQEGFSPCIAGYSIEGAFSHDLDMQRVANVLNMMDEVTVNEAEGWISVPGIMVFQEGVIIAKGKDQEKIRERIDTVRRLVVKAEECVGCGVCVARCKEGALMLDRDRVEIEVSRCVHCGRCIDPCPAVSYGDTTFDF
jgi:phosphoadenosine phosphosulfate reductase